MAATNRSELLTCQSTTNGQHNCSTNSTCYFYAEINSNGEFSKERLGCAGNEHIFCRDGTKANFIVKCCKTNFCNKYLREDAIFELRRLDRNDRSSTNYTPFIVGFVVLFIVAAAVLFFIKCYRRRPGKISIGRMFGNGNTLGIKPDQLELIPTLNRRTAAMDLQPEKKIGEGSFGRVYKATYKGGDVAVKYFSPEYRESFFREKSIYEFGGMKNDAVLKCIFCDEYVYYGHATYVLVMEFCARGSLRDLLQAEAIDEELCLNMAYDIANGLSYLHREIVVVPAESGKPAIAHCDLKSTNILLRSNLKCVIGDFGFSKLHSSILDCDLGSVQQGDDGDSSRQTMASDLSAPQFRNQIIIGTVRYLAPEILTESINVKDFNAFKQSDVYSFGLVLWEIGTRTVVGDKVTAYSFPFMEYTGRAQVNVELMKSIVTVKQWRPSLPTYWIESENMRKFSKIIQECWSQKPESRLTAFNCHLKLKALAETFQREQQRSLL